jgi:hypothetical protein
MEINAVIMPGYNLQDGETQKVSNWINGLIQEPENVCVLNFCTDSFMDNLNDFVVLGDGNLPEADPSFKQKYLLVKITDVKNKVSASICDGSPSLFKYFGNTVTL